MLFFNLLKPFVTKVSQTFIFSLPFSYYDGCGSEDRENYVGFSLVTGKRL